jgi:hypothetical protein
VEVRIVAREDIFILRSTISSATYNYSRVAVTAAIAVAAIGAVTVVAAAAVAARREYFSIQYNYI